MSCNIILYDEASLLVQQRTKSIPGEEVKEFSAMHREQIIGDATTSKTSPHCLALIQPLFFFLRLLHLPQPHNK
jgi:hypothetical protein